MSESSRTENSQASGNTSTKTGAATGAVGAMIRKVKEVSDIPCAVGFGIATPDQAKDMAAVADGVIVGSAIVKIVAKYGEECVPYVSDYVKSMKEAI